MKPSTIKYFFRESFSGLKKNMLMTMASMVAVAACISILSFSYCVGSNLQYMLDQMVTVTRNHWGFSEESFMRYLEQISFSKEFFVKAFKLFLERSTPEWFTKLLRSCYRLLRKE